MNDQSNLDQQHGVLVAGRNNRGISFQSQYDYQSAQGLLLMRLTDSVGSSGRYGVPKGSRIEACSVGGVDMVYWHGIPNVR